MNDTARAVRRPRWAWRPAAHIATATIGAAVLAVPVAASGGSPSAIVAGGRANARGSALSERANAQQALAYSRCMRSHHVPKFPDPASSGVIPKVSPQQLGVSSSQLQLAQKACQNLLPAGTDDQFPPGEVQQLLVGMLRFSQCMRSHGVPDWPDPTTDSEGRPIFPLPAAGISRREAKSPQVTHAGGDCQHLLPAALPGIPIG